MDERRRRLRVPAHYSVHIEHQGHKSRAQTLDLSLRGALCIAGKPMAEGTDCVFLLTLENGVVLAMDAQVARVDGDETALRFTGMPPETYIHLRNMIELLSGNADEVEAEEVMPLQ